MTESDAKKKLKALLDFEGDNFLGSGLSLQELLLKNQIERWQNSISCLHNPQEERRRIKVIRRIALAMEKIEQAHGCFNFAALDRGIVAVINGDWAECQRIADDLKYEDEIADTRYRIAQWHAPIRALLLEACEQAVPNDADVRH